MSDDQNHNRELEDLLDQAGQWCQPRHVGWETLTQRLGPQQPTSPCAIGRHRKLGWAAGIAVSAACLVLAMTLLWRHGRQPIEPAQKQETAASSVPAKDSKAAGAGSVAAAARPAVPLAAGWRVEPTGNAEYRVEKPDRIRLERGELFVDSVPLPQGVQPRLALNIETPGGTATAAGTRFFIGTHVAQPLTPPTSKGEAMTRITRVLVLTGLVTLVNAHGSVTGQSNQLLAAEADKPPANYAIAATGDFALDLYGRLAKENPGKNLFFSPYSMSSALTMTAEGARGETAAEMGKVLRFPEAARHIGNDAQLIPWNVGLIHSGMAALNERLNAANKAVPKKVRERIAVLREELKQANSRAAELMKEKNRDWEQYNELANSSHKIVTELNKLLTQVDRYELHLANALWGEKTYPFRQTYLETINKHYQTGGIFPVDFVGAPDGSRKQINAWVENQTQDRIKDLIPAGTVNNMMRLVLTNAIYFKGQWAEVFEEKDTKKDDFTLTDGAKIRTPLMHRFMNSARYVAIKGDGTCFETPQQYNRRAKIDERKLYPDEHGFQMLELPYKGGELSMVLVVPRAADGLESLEKLITVQNLQAWIGGLQKREVEVFMPKFKLETNYEMNRPLQAMGMVRAFKLPTEPDGAQFDGMCASSGPEHKLFISKVLHKAFVEVHEKGTEAAAATAVLMRAAEAPLMVPFTPTFRANRPFLFLIRDRQTGCILFLGRMMNPSVLGTEATTKGPRDVAAAAEPAKHKAKSTDPFEFMNRGLWISGMPYREAKEEIDPASLSRLHAALKDPAQASRWPAIAVLIGYLGNDETSARAILDYVRRAEDWKGLQEPAHYHRVVCKAQMIMWAGKMGDKHSVAVLRAALTPEGTKELAKEWINGLPQWGTKDDLILNMIRGYAAEGLVLGQDPEGLQAAEQFYKEVHASFKQGKIHYKLHDYLVVAMAKRDAIAEIGKEAYLNTVGTESDLLGRYFPKYR